MISHSTHQTSQSEATSSSENFIPHAKLDVLQAIADKYYEPMKKIAEKSDDEQPSFTSEGVQYVMASALTAKMALRAAQMAGQKSA